MNVRLPSVAMTSLATFCASSFLASAVPRVSMSLDFQTRTADAPPWATRAANATRDRNRFISVCLLAARLGNPSADEVGALAREREQVLHRGLELVVRKRLE